MKDLIQAEGTVTKALSNAQFSVELDNGCIIIAYVSGKMKHHNIWVIENDRVTVEISKYDLTKGRIIFRKKKGDK